MSEAEWGPWIECDGSGGPKVTATTRCQVGYVEAEADGLLVAGEEIAPDFAGFFWRWKRVRTGWFGTKLRRVCDDLAYAPIKRYRFLKPRSTAITRLAEIVANPPGAWIRDDTDADRRLPKRVKA